MEFLLVVANNDLHTFDTRLNTTLPTIGGKFKCAIISDKPDSTLVVTTSDKYNNAIKVVHDNNLVTDDLVLVFVKEDSKLLDKSFIDKLDYVFSEDDKIGVVGVSGVTTLTSDNSMYCSDNGVVGKMSGVSNDDVSVGDSGFYTDIVGVNDSLFAVRFSLFEDDSFRFLPGKHSGMGIDIAMKTNQFKYDVVVCDILVEVVHSNNVDFNQIQSISNEYGEFPITVDTFTHKRDHIVEISL